MAVISGAKFAYPNGIRLKYENVSLTLSVGDGAKVQTAPSGNASNTIVKAGKTTKLNFFHVVYLRLQIPIYCLYYTIMILL